MRLNSVASEDGPLGLDMLAVRVGGSWAVLGTGRCLVAIVVVVGDNRRHGEVGATERHV